MARKKFKCMSSFPTYVMAYIQRLAQNEFKLFKHIDVKLIRHLQLERTMGLEYFSWELKPSFKISLSLENGCKSKEK